MGYSTRVTGWFGFERREDTSEAAAKRKELTAQIVALGGRVQFDYDLDGLSPTALDILHHDSDFESIQHFFSEIDSEGINADGESGKAYWLKEQLERLIKLADEDGVDVEGEIRLEGEDSLDVSKIVIKNRRLDVVRPTITWPDGTIETYKG